MKPKQILAIWQLILTGEEPKLSEFKLLSKAERAQLQEAGLIEIEKRGRASHILLTDRAWLWATQQDVSGLAQFTSPVAAATLEKILQRLSHFLQTQELSLVEFLYPQPPTPSEQPASLEERIEAAYLKCSGGVYNRRVRLIELRPYFADLPRETLDQTLRAMMLDSKLVLMHLDDPMDRTAADDQAAINIGGRTHHIIYLRENNL